MYKGDFNLCCCLQAISLTFQVYKQPLVSSAATKKPLINEEDINFIFGIHNVSLSLSLCVCVCVCVCVFAVWCLAFVAR